MKILVYGLNYAPEPIGIGKYSGEMAEFLADLGHEIVVITAPPYYPHWKIAEGYRGWFYSRDRPIAGMNPSSRPADASSTVAAESPCKGSSHRNIEVIRCPLWVPQQASGLKRILHLMSYAASSVPAVLWKTLTFRPDVIFTVEPSSLCMPTAWSISKLTGAKSWLHVQDFEIDAASALGLLKKGWMTRTALRVEASLMRRFDRVSSISPNMLKKLGRKGVSAQKTRALPNWVDCNEMKPLSTSEAVASGGVDSHSGDRDASVAAAAPSHHNIAEARRKFQTALRQEFGLPNDKCIALYAGNMGAKQGLDIILEAAERSSEESNVHFVMCGTGAAAEQLAKRSAGQSNVQWLPVQPPDRFNALMNCADIHLLPQRSGAADLVMPSKLTGMLATGRPIVACAAEGTQIAEVVQGRGIVVRPDDVEAFAAAITDLANDPESRMAMGTAARQYAVRTLSRDSILMRFDQDLKELCKGTKPSTARTKEASVVPPPAQARRRGKQPIAETGQ